MFVRYFSRIFCRIKFSFLFKCFLLSLFHSSSPFCPSLASYIFVETIFLSIYWKVLFSYFFCSIWCGYRAIYWITNSKYTKMLENTDWKPSHANKPPNKNSCLAFPRISFENGWIKIGNSFDKMFFFHLVQVFFPFLRPWFRSFCSIYSRKMLSFSCFGLR